MARLLELMRSEPETHPARAGARVDWVDTAKGICIILVVMMHSVAGYQQDIGGIGWMEPIVAFAQPFRMPDFFLLSALFLFARIDAGWRLYLDRKVVHFVYFYLLWVSIQCFVKCYFQSGGDWTEFATTLAYALIQPYGVLWFIYALAVFFVVTKLVKDLPPLLVGTVAAVLHIAPISTGHVLIDQFCAMYVYFYAGYILSGRIFLLADWVRDHQAIGWSIVALWALANGTLVFSGFAQAPGVTLMLGFAGALAIVLFSALIAHSKAGRALAVPGAHSIAVYLAFFLPMAATRIILIETGIIPDIGLASFIVMSAAILLPLAGYFMVRNTSLRFLFDRPDWARIVPAGSPKKASGPIISPQRMTPAE